ncbi:NACHT domain-containing NTPase [Vibrio cholerae]|nr:hypothetical protein [Vibrio cholerae]
MEDNIKDKYCVAMQSLKEDDFTKEILVPLFKAMNYDRVEFNGGPNEKGRDLIATRLMPPPVEEEFVVYIQSKKINDKSKKIAQDQLIKLCRQLKQAKNKGFLKCDGTLVNPNVVFVATPYKITQRFMEDIEDELLDDNLGKWLKILDCIELIRFIEKYSPDILEKLEPFEDKIWSDKNRINTNRNHELLGALCSVRGSIDLSKFYSDLSFFVGSIDSRALISLKTKVSSRQLSLFSKDEWVKIKSERKKIMNLVGLDIFICSDEEIEKRFNEQNEKYSSRENKNNIISYNSAIEHFKSIKEEFNSRSHILYQRLESDLKNLDRTKFRMAETYLNQYKLSIKNINHGDYDVKFSTDCQEWKLLPENIKTIIDACFLLVEDYAKSLLEQSVYISDLKCEIISEPSYDIEFCSDRIEREISDRVDEYRKCVKQLNEKDRPDLSKVRKLLDSVEVSLKFFEFVYEAGSFLRSIIEFERLNVEPDRVSISAHDVFYTGKDVAVYGGAGVGKTTTLEMFFKNYSEGISGKKIIFCSLNRVMQNLSKLELKKKVTRDTTVDEMNEIIYSIILSSYGVDIDRENIERLLPYFDKGVVIVFDGLDEIITDYPIVLNAMNVFKRKHPNVQWIISSRDCVSYLKEIDFLGITLLPFTKSQLKNFIYGWFDDTERYDKLWNQISSVHLHENLLTPLVATILCTLVEKGVKAPTNESEIYNERLSLLLGKYDLNKKIKRQEQSSNELLICAKTLAWSMHSNGIRSISEEKALEILISNLNSKYEDRLVKNCLKELEDPCNILIRDKVSNTLSFGHFRFQEHLVSLELKDNRSLDLTWIILKDWWRGAFCLYAQSINDIESIIDELTRGGSAIVDEAFTTLDAMCNVLTPEKRLNMKQLLNLHRNKGYDVISHSHDEFDIFDRNYSARIEDRFFLG